MPKHRRYTNSQDGIKRTTIIVRFRADKDTVKWLEERRKTHTSIRDDAKPIYATIEDFLHGLLVEGIDCEEIRSEDDERNAEADELARQEAEDTEG